jgi:hypothetical protein
LNEIAGVAGWLADLLLHVMHTYSQSTDLNHESNLIDLNNYFFLSIQTLQWTKFHINYSFFAWNSKFKGFEYDHSEQKTSELIHSSMPFVETILM